MPDIESSLARFIRDNQPLFVLTGAGCSTAAGIPDYRDEQGEWKQGQPVQFQDFCAHTYTRKRYWARSMLGWPLISGAQPTTVHRLLQQLEQADLVNCLVTQNVDQLHQKAGSTRVLDLHGNLETVSCLQCAYQLARSAVQDALRTLNPGLGQSPAVIAPDGDAVLESIDYEDFTLVDCPQCGGILKPDVVFFGESVPKERVTRAMQYLQVARAMLVLGSSLMVFSGYRFCRTAKAADKAVCIINKGRTRADDEVNLKIDADCAATLGNALAQLHL